MASQPYILTLKLDQQTFDALDTLRRRHFPPERNLLPAHLTLFHALPGDHDSSIRLTLKGVAAATAPLPLHFPNIRSLGRGVAITVDAPELTRLRRRLATTWNEWLSAQDRQGYRPHVTIQNKVTSDQARTLYDQLAAEWEPFTGRGEGLLLWRYIGGPWEHAGEFPLGETD